MRGMLADMIGACDSIQLASLAYVPGVSACRERP